MAEAEIYRQARAFRERLLRQEAEQWRMMARYYRDLMARVQDNIDRLVKEITKLQEAGKPVSIGRVYRLQRYQRLLVQMASELRKFDEMMLRDIEQRKVQLGLQGIDDAAKALSKLNPGIEVRFDRLHKAAIEEASGLASDGSPLAGLFASINTELATAMSRTIVESIAMGRHPRVTARLLVKTAHLPLQRAVTIARTEQLRAYRVASLETYRQNGVRRYQRLAARNGSVCIGCLSRDGEILEIEALLDDHPNGHCTVVPLIEGIDMPELEAAERWFARQDPTTKLSIMGGSETRLKLYEGGKAGWSDLATHSDNPRWGGAWNPTPIRDLMKKAS